MTGKRIQGIDTVLSHLVSGRAEETDKEPASLRRNAPRPESSSAAGRPTVGNGRRARLGRPLGRHAEPQAAREKITVRIPSNLVAEYRDWSWDARSSLSGLVEKAMVEYRRRFGQ